MKITLNNVSPQLVEGILNRILELLPDRDVPPLYSSGIRYRRDPGEVWQTPTETASVGYGDCEDLALYRAYELRTAGIPAQIRVYQATPKTMHVVVERKDGVIEDPSRALGMLDPENQVGEDPVVTPIDPVTATAMAANTIVPGGGVVVQLLATPEGRKLLKRLKKFV